VISLALADRDDFALLWFIFGRIRDDEAASSGANFFYSAHQNAVMQWGKLRGHTCRLPSFVFGCKSASLCLLIQSTNHSSLGQPRNLWRNCVPHAISAQYFPRLTLIFALC